ncbi:hypothetical protein GGE07_004020 [Sinorhizobium terangae]|uniref:Uncharacterized protein n=1 Tax=Sinorhizobium terangae TaxID=110322 RepID=A0A6N7LAK5_SINTE|nr:hypothetical protein [Sinorhizobium terangae]MBB4187356.1 hypothetical protein [Sinorhizobium terangae]MQX14636.1 hypothetical protein [Sinorhizobium terangae]
MSSKIGSTIGVADYAWRYGMNARDFVTNIGKMIGDVRLGAGDDVFDGQRGLMEARAFSQMGRKTDD